MKFQTKDLIARIDETVARMSAAARQENAKAASEMAANRTEWIAFHMPLYMKLAATIRTLDRKGLPVTKADIPKGLEDRYGDSLRTWDPRANQVSPRTEGLLALRAALSACTDDTVTTTGLRELGFRDINTLFAGAR